MSRKLCECGCGELSPIATKTNKKRGWVKGNSLRFIRGHNGRLRPKGSIEYKIDNSTGCWVWTRSLQPNGYGHLTINNRQVLAHRFVYEKLRDKIPDGHELDHLCGNPACVNPEHLEPVTHAENCRRGKRAKLNHEVVKTIRQLYKSGLNISQLSRKFGVARHTISSAVKGESWG